jgi:type IV pilus assembly protein PilW
MRKIFYQIRQAAPGARRPRGFTLIELMISISIGMGLLLALATVFSNSSTMQAELTRTSQQIENGRFATQLLQEDLRHAGFYGRYVAWTTSAGLPGSLPNPCSTNIDPATASPTPLQSSLIFAVSGYDAPTAAAAATALATCAFAEANFKAGTDILVIRRADTKPTALASLVGTTVYLQSVAETMNLISLQAIAPVIAKGNTPAAFNLTGGPTNVAGEIRRFRVHIYFISPCSVFASGTTCTSAADGGVPIPTLKRLELAADGTFQIVPLVEGIEDLQIDFGVDTVPGTVTATEPYAGDGMPDSYTKTPSIAQFTQVTSARIYVLARSTEMSRDYADAKTYDLGLHGTFTPTGDATKYKRHLFATTVRLQNVVGWREK